MILEFMVCWIALSIGGSLLVGRAIGHMQDTPEEAAVRRAEPSQEQRTSLARMPALD